MRIKDTKGKTNEMVFLIVATILTGALLWYGVLLVRHLVVRADSVFTIDLGGGGGVPTFHFQQYDKLLGVSSTPPLTTTPASGTPALPSAATSTVGGSQ
jgi:hypothetical protein